MVVAVSGTKKCPSNIRAPAGHQPVLVSPMSVAHRNQMLDCESSKASHNWMRDQWVANLKKKRMVGMGNNGHGVHGESRVHATSNMQANRGGRNRSQSNPRSARTQSEHTGLSQPTEDPTTLYSEKDLLYPSMFFNEMGCVEIESQCFTTLPANMSSSISVSSPSASHVSEKVDPKKWMKPIMKKRCPSLDVNQPKPRTPRRKLNCGSAFEDLDLLSSTQNNYSSVGTPSNINADTTHLWGHDGEFAVGDFVDTFLDLPTPKLAEIPILPNTATTPTCTSINKSSTNTSTNSNSCINCSKNNHERERDYEQPKLIRHTSIEQTGLSHYFEQAHLGEPSTTTKSANPVFGYAVAIDDCYRNNVHPTSSYFPLSARGHAHYITPRTNPFEHQKHVPEMETLLEEYKFTDIDQELDSFYLDTIEPLGGEIDLIS